MMLFFMIIAAATFGRVKKIENEKKRKIGGRCEWPIVVTVSLRISISAGRSSREAQSITDATLSGQERRTNEFEHNC